MSMGTTEALRSDTPSAVHHAFETPRLRGQLTSATNLIASPRAVELLGAAHKSPATLQALASRLSKRPSELVALSEALISVGAIRQLPDGSLVTDLQQIVAMMPYSAGRTR